MNAAEFAGTFAASFWAAFDRKPCETVALAIYDLALGLYASERPTPQTLPHFKDALVAVAGITYSELPDFAFASSRSPIAVPLYAVVDLPRFVDPITQPFLKPYSKNIFPDLNQSLTSNLARASGIAWPIMPRQKLVYPQDYRVDTRQELILAYLDGTPLLHLMVTPIPFSIPRKAYQEHGAIFAPTGHGKTQTLGSFIHAFLSEPDPPGMFILDSRGKMLREIEKLDLFHPETGRLKDRLVIIDPEDENPPALNLFKLGIADPRYQASANDLFDYLFTALDAALTSKMGVSVNYLIKFMNALERPSIDTFLEMMEADIKDVRTSQYGNVISQLPPHVQNFFRNQFFNKAAMGQTRLGIARRLYSVIAHDTFRKMFSAPDNRFNAYSAMQEKKIVLINTAAQFLGEKTSAVFGRFFIAMILAAALQRKHNERDLCLLIVDEASEYFDDKTERILSRARQYGLGLLFATQFIEQMPDKVKEAVNGNTAIKMAGPVSYKDASNLGKEMYSSGEFLRSMKKVDGSHADFACHVRGLTPHAIKLTIPYGALENAPKMDEAARAQLRATNRTRVGAQAQETKRDRSRAKPPQPTDTPPTGQDHVAIKPGKEW